MNQTDPDQLFSCAKARTLFPFRVRPLYGYCAMLWSGKRSMADFPSSIKPALKNPLAYVVAAGISICAVGSVHAAGETDSNALDSGQNASEKGEDEIASVEVFDAVVITSRNRKELAQSVPIPTSVVGARELERDNSVTALDFANKVPSLSIVQNQPRQSSFSIRGIGKNNSNEFTEGSVGVIIDNVYIVHPGASWGNFYDLDRIEVARGPQGTLLGKNTTLGVVNIISKAPSFQQGERFQLSYGDLNTVRGSAVVTGPLVENVLAYRVNLGYEKGEGFIKNTHHHGETLNDLNRVNAKVQFLVVPSDKLTVKLSADFNRSEEYNGAWPFNYGDPATYQDGAARETYASRLARFTGEKSSTIMNSWSSYQANDMGRLISESKGWSGQVEYELNSGHTITSITAARRYLFAAHNDYDILDTGWSGGHVQTRQFSQELRLTSPTGGFFDYQTGLYYLEIKHRTGSTPGTVGGPDSGRLSANASRFNTLNATAVGRDLLLASRDGVYTQSRSTPEVDSLGVYGQVNWHLTDKAILTTGLRRTWEDRFNSNQSWVWGGTALTAANFPGASAAELTAANAIRSTPEAYADASLNETSWSWLINPSYKLNKDVLLYASVAYGERSGTVSISRGQGEFTKPERATDYEIGIKSTLLGKRLRLNANLFLTDVRDYQVSLRKESETTLGEYVTAFDNAEKVTSKGIEFDIEYAFTSKFNISASGAWNPARYDSWKNGRCPANIRETTTTVCDNSGKRVAGSSDKSLTLTTSYQAPLNHGLQWNFFASNIYRSDFDASPNLTPEGRQKGFSILNVGIGIGTTDGKYTLSLDGRNILDKVYFTSYNDYGTGTVGRVATGQRRFIGLTFRANL
jgi:iron complex outermembrane receptor protein